MTPEAAKNLRVGDVFHGTYSRRNYTVTQVMKDGIVETEFTQFAYGKTERRLAKWTLAELVRQCELGEG